MTGLLLAAAVLAIIVTITLIVGSRLPREHIAAVRAKYTAAPSVIWPIISDPVHSASWRKELKSVEPLPAGGGHPAWREVSGNGTIDYEIAEALPTQRLVTRITSKGLPYGGQWEYTLAPAGSGSELTITERGFVNPPFFRVMSRFVFGLTSSLQAYHSSLATKLGETVAPEIVATGR
jgi:hypothetical protein